MSRHLAAITALCLGLLATILALALVVQYQLFKDHRLSRYEVAHAAVIAELRKAIEQQLSSGTELASASRLLTRFASLQTRSELVTSILVLDDAGQTVFEFTAPLVQSARPASTDLRQWPQDWRRLGPAAEGRPLVASLRGSDSLHVATPIRPRGHSAGGLLVIGLQSPVDLREFLLGGMSPALVALASLFLGGLLSAGLAWRLGRDEALAGVLAPGATGDGALAWARLGESADRLAQAHVALRRIPQSGPGSGAST